MQVQREAQATAHFDLEGGWDQATKRGRPAAEYRTKLGERGQCCRGSLRRFLIGCSCLLTDRGFQARISKVRDDRDYRRPRGLGGNE